MEVAFFTFLVYKEHSLLFSYLNYRLAVIAPRRLQIYLCTHQAVESTSLPITSAQTKIFPAHFLPDIANRIYHLINNQPSKLTIPLAMTISNRTLRLLLPLLFGLCPLWSFSVNIAIIESQSYHPMQAMDTNWETVITNMGHSPFIFPQDALDDLANFDNIDILILSSGLIDIPTNRRTTLKDFYNSGRNMYIQSEYQISHPGNMVFAEIINENGNAFNWSGESSGNIMPMDVLCDLSSNLHIVNSLNYFWYGTYGQGDATVTPFLVSNDKNYGFTYKPSDNSLGYIVTTTDQDWVRILASEDLMQNILHLLITNPPVPQATSISITLTNQPACENGLYTFSSTLQNPTPSISYQWLINGSPVVNENNDIFVTSDLSEGDVVECFVHAEINCQEFDHVSNPILIAPIFPIEEATWEINSSTGSICLGEEVTFLSDFEIETTASNIAYQWLINNSDVFGANEETFTTNNLNNGDIVSCNVQYTDACNNLQTQTSNEISIAVSNPQTPSIEIIPNIYAACENEEVTFIAQGSHWGDNPSFQWQVDGLTVGGDESYLSIYNLQNGQSVTCILTSSENCLTSNQVVSLPVNIEIFAPLSPSLSIEANTYTACQGDEVTFSATGDNWGDNPFFSWMINGQTIGNNEPTLTTSNLFNGDVVTCNIQMDANCLTSNEINANANPVNILSNVTPVIYITSNVQAACSGEDVLFSATIQNGGDNPSLEWMIDGEVLSTNGTTFSTNSLQDGQIVSCRLISNTDCASNTEVISNEIAIDISNITLILNQQSDDYCGMHNGKIQVGVNFAIPPVTYTWSNGANTSSIQDLAAGSYSVTATDATDCSTTLNVEINERYSIQITDIELQHSTCNKHNGTASVTMADPSLTYFYTWMTPSGNVLGTESIIRDLPPGTYLLEVTDATDCFLLEEFEILSSSSLSLELEERITVDWGTNVKLEPYITSDSEVQYEWSPATGLNCTDCPNPIFTAEEEITYTLTLSNSSGCTQTKSIHIYVEKERNVFVPTAFSPNGDGYNDRFIAYGDDKVKIIKSLHIVDRWGNVLFKKENIQANEEAAGWDGTFRGKIMNSGVYLYHMEVVYRDGLVHHLSGDITLVR